LSQHSGDVEDGLSGKPWPKPWLAHSQPATILSFEHTEAGGGLGGWDGAGLGGGDGDEDGDGGGDITAAAASSSTSGPAAGAGAPAGEGEAAS
jgi:hypothetical protein